MFEFRDNLHKTSNDWKYQLIFWIIFLFGGSYLDRGYQQYYSIIMMILYSIWMFSPLLLIGKEYDDLIKIYRPSRKLMNTPSDIIQFILLMGLIVAGYFVFKKADILVIIIYLVILLLTCLLMFANNFFKINIGNTFERILLTKSKLIVYINSEKNEFELDDLKVSFPRLDEIYLERTIQGKKKSILTDIRFLAKKDKDELKKHLENIA